MRYATIAILVLVLAGCAGTNFSYQRASKVTVGMSESEVVSLMGRPYQVISMPDSERWIWSHANGFSGSAKAMSMEFRGGHVSAVPKIPQSFLNGTSAQSQQLAKPEWTKPGSVVSPPATIPSAPSKAQYQQEQLNLLMQENLPYEEYMKRYKALMSGSSIGG
jgi:hypothetical protein